MRPISLLAISLASLGLLEGCTGGPAAGGSTAPVATWKASSTMPAIHSVALVSFQAVGSQRVYAWGYAQRTHAFCLYRTRNGGQTWTNLAEQSSFPTRRGGPLWNQPYTVFFRTAAEGYVGFTGPVPGDVSIAQTVDGGTTWQKTQLPKPQGIYNGSMEALSSPDPQHAFALVTGGYAAGHENRDLYATGDNGQHWYRIYSDTSGTAYASTGMEFVNARRGFITLASQDSTPRVDMTTDGGYTWHTVSLPTPIEERSSTAQTMPPQFFPGQDRRGYLAALYTNNSMALYNSNDRGHTFSFTATPTPLLAVAFATPARGIALGSKRILRTSNGGQVWQALFPDPTLRDALRKTPTVLSLQETENGEAWILLRGDTGTDAATTLLRSLDNGAHWERVL